MQIIHISPFTLIVLKGFIYFDNLNTDGASFCKNTATEAGYRNRCNRRSSVSLDVNR
jgi:hypothetical protein